MKKLFAFILALLAFVEVKANDGAFFSNGSQLIPITETDISVKKEILTITRVYDTARGNLFQVHVYYEFYNPGKAKDLIVGFESPSPDGNATYGTLDEAYAGQPYIYDFKVKMNRNSLPYQLAHVPYKFKGDYQFDYTMDAKDYYKNGRVQDVTKDQYRAAIAKVFDNEEYVEWNGYLFYYVYHFNAHFNEGLNVIEHTYTFKGSSLVMMDYMFNYILTAANRWANNGIDDFTLQLDMGENASFSVAPSFFQNASEWTFTGKGKVTKRETMISICEDCPMFHVQSGSLVFHKKNFHPEGELHIGSDSFYLFDFVYNGKIDHTDSFLELFKQQYYRLYMDKDLLSDKSGFTNEQMRILKNIPFAYHGYVFKDQGLKNYFESTKWYVPNPDYKSDMTKMSKNEKEWIMFWTK